MAWTSPFSLTGVWLKGCLHAHTTQSDGVLSPEDAISWYRSHGYDFLALTDHWVLTPGDGRGPEDGFCTISGTELDGPGYHMVALGISELPSRDLRDSPQDLINTIAASGGLSYYAHPYWTAQTATDIAKTSGYSGIEVYNSACEVAVGLGIARVHWDELLAGGLRVNAIAVDDVHWRHGEAGLGFVMVRATQLDEQSILEALRQGHFYSSGGPTILDLRVTATDDGPPALRVHCSPCRFITFHGWGPTGMRFTATADELLQGAILPMRAEQVYLRVECEDTQGRIAWSNPVYVEDVLGN